MLAALGLDAIRSRFDELGIALIGVLLGVIGVVAPWITQGDLVELGIFSDEGKLALLTLVAGFAGIWRYANAERAGDLLAVLIAGVVTVLIGAAELIQLESGSDSVVGRSADPGWGLWVFLIAGSTLTLGALAAAQLRANRAR